jgi:predicted RNA binding protein YcfA (HicA-like mRNA interferase family)
VGKIRNSRWSATKAKLVLAALLRKGWTEKRREGSHRTLSKSGWENCVFAYHDGEEIGPKALARIEKKTGMRPEDL